MSTIGSVLVQIDLQVDEMERQDHEFAKLIENLLKLCPAQPGMTVPVTDGVYKGKSMLVKSIAVVGNFRGRTPRAFRINGVIIHKNGKQSRLHGNFEISLKDPTL